MIQIMLLYDINDPEDVRAYERLKRGFDKMGCWSVELPPKGSIYKTVLTLEKENLRKGEE